MDLVFIQSQSKLQALNSEIDKPRHLAHHSSGKEHKSQAQFPRAEAVIRENFIHSCA
jgi:hypothetical protein